MKNFARAFILLTSCSLAFVSCKDSDKDPAPAYASVGLVKSSVDAKYDVLTNSFQYNLQRTQYSDVRLPSVANIKLDDVALTPTRPTINLTIDLYDQRDYEITKIYVYKTRRGGTNASTYTYGPRVLFREIPASELPKVLTFDTQEALAGLQRIGTATPAGSTAPVSTLFDIKGATTADNNQVFNGDAVVFTYEYDVNTPSGPQRIILTPVRKVSIRNPAPTTQVDVISGAQINAPFATVISFTNSVL